MTLHAKLQADLPEALREALAGYDWQQQTVGASGAGVFRLEAAGKPELFLKTEATGPFAELPDEVTRLRWLGSQGIACPGVLAFETHAGLHWLLMTSLPGGDLVTREIAAAEAVALMAGALRRLHALDIAACPFDHRLSERIPLAKARMEAGVVDVEDFDDEWLGQRAEAVFEQLLARRPAGEDLVVTHGDASMPNFIADGGRFSGFIDCSRLGVADRFQDLGILCWSIHFNLGPEWIAPFLELYGEPNAEPARLAYYQLLDEFF